MSRYRRKNKVHAALKARTQSEKCRTKWCRNRRVIKCTRYRSAGGKIIVYKSTLPYCWKCKAKRLRERHPHTYVLNMLRHSARKRNIPFTLTLAQFKEFCDRTGYLRLRGQEPSSLTVDRIDRTEGYHHWNIQTLSHAINSAQGADNTPRDESPEENWEPAPLAGAENDPF